MLYQIFLLWDFMTSGKYSNALYFEPEILMDENNRNLVIRSFALCKVYSGFLGDTFHENSFNEEKLVSRMQLYFICFSYRHDPRNEIGFI